MQRIVRIGALNVVTHPHSAAGYQQLIKKVYDLRKAARIRADRFGMISLPEYTAHPRSINAYTQGVVGTFTRIDAESDWINVRTGQRAEDQDRDALRNLPRNLQPNHAQNRFRFYLRNHVLFFEIGNSGHKLTQKNAEALFSRLFSFSAVVDQFGPVDVTVLPNRDTVQRILASQTLRSLRMVVKKPNPDDGLEAERQFMARLDRLNVRRVESIYIAEKDQAIHPDAGIRDEAKVASRNGQVDAVMLHRGRAHEVSTVDTPFEYLYEYDDRGTTAWQAFEHACEAAKGKLDEGG